MGNPNIYYRKVLRNLVFALAALDGNKSVEKFDEETLEEKLERYILKMKLSMEDKEFYYAAGRATQQTLANAYLEGGDHLNAAIGGLTEFEYFIGILEEAED